MVIELPGEPTEADKPVIVGAGKTVKFTLLLVCPPGTVTITGPLVAPSGTNA
jgi:hypothetical protein